MAKKKASKVVAKRGSNLPVTWQDKLAALAAQESDRVTAIGGSASIKLAKGKFKFQGTDLGETLSFVCVDFVKVRNWFDRPYDEDDPGVPACFSISVDGKNMAPDPTGPKIQSDDLCRNCWADEFGSDARERAKACREQYLLATVHADSLKKDSLDMEDVAFMRVPPTSLKAWDAFMIKRNKVFKLPALSFIVEASFDEDVDYQKLEFAELGRVEDKDTIEKLFELRELVHPILMTPPDVSNFKEKGSKKAKKKKKTTSKKKKKTKSRRYGG